MIRNSKEAMEIDRIVKENMQNNNDHYSDEENFVDLNIRAQKALDYLVQRKEKNI